MSVALNSDEGRKIFFETCSLWDRSGKRIKFEFWTRDGCLTNLIAKALRIRIYGDGQYFSKKCQRFFKQNRDDYNRFKEENGSR